MSRAPASRLRLLALATATAGATALAPLPARADAIDDYLATQMSANHIPGLALAVVRDGRVVKSAQYGQAELEWDRPVGDDTAFQLASATKLFTGVLLLRLQDEGRLSLDDEVARHLPEAPAAWRGMTLRHLLAHASGIPDDVASPPGGSVHDFVKAAAARPLVHAPGERSTYGIAGYVVLRDVVEHATGQAFAQALATRVLQPLGLRDTRFDEATSDGDLRVADLVPRRASVYQWQDGRQRRFAFHFGAQAQPAGGLFASSRDLATLAAALDGGRFLSARSMHDLETPFPTADGRPGSFTAGWAVRRVERRAAIGHSGGPALADVLRVPDAKLTVIVLANAQSMYPYLAAGVAQRLLPPDTAPATAAVPDPGPDRTGRFAAVLREAAGTGLPEAAFSDDARQRFLPAARDFLMPFLRSLPAPGTLVLMRVLRSAGTAIGRPLRPTSAATTGDFGPGVRRSTMAISPLASRTQAPGG